MNNFSKDLYFKIYGMDAVKSPLKSLSRQVQKKYIDFRKDLNNEQKKNFYVLSKDCAMQFNEDKAQSFASGFECGITYLYNMLRDGTISIDDTDLSKNK